MAQYSTPWRTMSDISCWLFGLYAATRGDSSTCGLQLRYGVTLNEKFSVGTTLGNPGFTDIT